MSLDSSTPNEPGRPGRRRPRRWRRGLSAGATLLLLLLVAIWLALPQIVERRLLAELAAAGFPDAEVRVAGIGFRRSRIVDLRLDRQGSITAREILVDYEPLGLLRGRVARVTIRDPHVAARLEGGRLLIGDLDVTQAGGTAPSRALALPPIAIENGRIALATPAGNVAIRLSGAVGPGVEGGADAQLDFRAEHSAAALAGRLDVTMAGDGAIDGHAMIAEGSLAMAEARAAAIHGDLRFSHSAAQPLALSAEIDLGGIAVGPARFPTGRLTAAVDAAAATAQLRLAADGMDTDLALDATVRGLMAAPQLDATIDATAGAASWLWPSLSLPPPSEGTAKLALRLAGPLPATALASPPTGLAAILALLGDSRLTGGAQFALMGMGWPKLANAVTATGHLALKPGLSGILQGDLKIEGSATPASTLLATLKLPGKLQEQLAGPLAFRLTSSLTLRADAEQAELVVAGAPTLDLAMGERAAANAKLMGHIRLSDALAPLSYYLESGELTASGLAAPYGRLENLAITGSLDGRRGEAMGRLAASVKLIEASVGGFAAGLAELDIDTRYSLAADKLTVSLGDGGALKLTQLTGPRIAGKLSALSLPIAAGDGPLLQAWIAAGRIAELSTDLRLGKLETRLPIRAGGAQPIPLLLALPGVRLSGSWTPGTGYRGTAEIAGASLSLPSIGIAATGIDGKAAIGAAGQPLTADLRIARLTHGGKTPTVLPVAVTAEAALAGDRLTFRTQLADAEKRLVIAIDGSHATDSGKGEARLKMQPLHFAPDGLQPRDLLPQLGRDLAETSGTVGLDGRLRWAGDHVTSNLKLLLEDLSTTLPQVQIAKLNSVVAVDSLFPFTTRPKQQVAIGLIDVGIPLSDALVTFDVGAGPILRIANARLSLAGGQVTVPPLTIDPAAARNDIQLKVTDVDLGQLLALAEIDGLSATGKLAGEIPVSVEGDALVIHDGLLEATGPGRLSYAPGQAPAALEGGGETVQMAMAALSNFHYTGLRITLDRDAGGDTVAVMQVRGSNPDFYGGYPVEFNLNVSGKLDQILDRGLAGYRVPAIIQQRLEEFKR